MIVSRQNPKLREIRRLRRERDGDGLLLEGPNLIEEAVRLDLPLETVLATPDFLGGNAARELAARLPRRPLEVSPPLLRELSDVDSPQGILAVARLRRPGPEGLPLKRAGVYVFAEGLQDPGNLGALARSVEAAGGAGLALAPGGAHPNHPRALRSSAGSLLRLAVVHRASLDALDERLGKIAPRWAALVPRDGESLYEADLTGTLVLAVGAEGSGLTAATRERCDLAVTLPAAPAVESLNATVAAAIALFEIRRQRSAASTST